MWNKERIKLCGVTTKLKYKTEQAEQILDKFYNNTIHSNMY